MENNAFYMWFCFYVAVVTTLAFIYTIKPFLQQNKEKKYGWYVLASVYLLHDWYWSFWHRWTGMWQDGIESVLVYGIILWTLHVWFQGRNAEKFGTIFGLDFIMQIVTLLFEYVIAMFAVGFKMEQLIPFMMEPRIPVAICMTVSMIPGAILTIQLYKLLQNINKKVLVILMCGLGIVNILSVIWNSPQCLQIVFPAFFILLLVSLFQQNAMIQQMKSQFVYYSQMSQVNSEKQEQMNRFRHDIANHISAMNSLDDEYASEVTKELQNSFPKQTGVDVWDSLFYLKQQDCQQQNIETSWALCFLQDSKMTKFDGVSLFANLLDNAIEACQSVEKEKKLGLDMKRDNNYLLITITNSKDVERKPIANHFFTTKSDRKEHGMGIKIIREVIQKYDGYIEYQDHGTSMEANLCLAIWE